MDYLDIANSRVLYVISSCILGFLMLQALFFYRMARKRAIKELNIDPERIRKAVKAAVISSILPSVAIIIGLIAMAPSLGIPISWARLGMIGSLIYEVLVAAVGATSMGAEGLGKSGYTPQAFANSVWLMTLGMMPAFLWAILFLRKYKEGVNKVISRDKAYQNIILGTILASVQIVFAVPSIMNGGNELLAFGFSACMMIVLAFVITKWKQDWLKEYALSLSMLSAIMAVILFNL